MATRKTALEKLHVNKQPHIVSPIPAGFPGSTTAQSMVVSTPLEVNEVVRQIPAGKLVTLNHIRAFLAQRHGTDITCPVSTGIFINIVAQASEELSAMGQAEAAPYWRVLKGDGELNDKYPGGLLAHKQKLEAEGHQVIQRKKAYVVEDFATKQYDLIEELSVH